MAEKRAGRELRSLERLGIAVGTFACVVSFALFIHTISQLSSPLVSALFIAAGIVGRQRSTTSVGQTVAVTTIVGGVVAAVSSLVLVATGH